MYHIVTSDLDGTLLSPQNVLTPYAKETLRSLTQRGIHFIFATGRHHIDVTQIRNNNNLGISAFMITSNGARVHDPVGKLIVSHNLDRDIVQELYNIERDNHNILTNVYRNDDWLINRDQPENGRYFHTPAFNYQRVEMEQLETDGVCKVYFTCHDHQQLLPLEETINARWGDRVSISFSFPTCLEVMGGGVSKGHALDRVAEIIGYSLNECIAFGDGMNDFEMLSMAGKGCIMQNAHQRLKEMLPKLEVIGTNVDDAVPHYLHKMFLA